MAKVYLAWGRSQITNQPYLIGVYRHFEDARQIKDALVTAEDITESVEHNIILHLETGQQMEISPKESVTIQDGIGYARQLKVGDVIKVKRRESTHDFVGDTQPGYVKILEIRGLKDEREG